MPFVEYFSPSTGYIAGALLILTNTTGIVFIGLLFSMPLNYLFRRKGYLAALLISIVIVGWSLFVWIDHSQEIPNYISIIEWLTVIIVLPVVTVVVCNMRTGGINE